MGIWCPRSWNLREWKCHLSICLCNFNYTKHYYGCLDMFQNLCCALLGFFDRWLTRWCVTCHISGGYMMFTTKISDLFFVKTNVRRIILHLKNPVSQNNIYPTNKNKWKQTSQKKSKFKRRRIIMLFF